MLRRGGEDAEAGTYLHNVPPRSVAAHIGDVVMLVLVRTDNSGGRVDCLCSIVQGKDRFYKVQAYYGNHKNALQLNLIGSVLSSSPV